MSLETLKLRNTRTEMIDQINPRSLWLLVYFMQAGGGEMLKGHPDSFIRVVRTMESKRVKEIHLVLEWQTWEMKLL